MNNCRTVNTIWIDKGIILTIIYYLLKKNNVILNKKIIIDNTRYRILIKTLFPNLKITKYEDDDVNNFYFNIRKIIKKQDIIIDYLSNYDDCIRTKKIKLIPWFDMNDILVSYHYNKKKKLYIDKYLNFIKNFNKCRRGNYNNEIYDKYIENKILDMYLQFNKNITLSELNNIIEKYIYKSTDTVNTYFIPVMDEKIMKKNNEKEILINNLTKQIDILKKINLEKQPQIKEIVKEIIIEKQDYNNIKKKYIELKNLINNTTLHVNNILIEKDNVIKYLIETMDEYIHTLNELHNK